MRRRFCLLMSLLAVCATGLAGTVKGSFGQGVLGIAWGTSLTSVVGVYPQGDHVFAVTPGCRAYWVKEGQPFLGIPRDGKGVLFGMDKQNHVASASVAFDFERKGELRTTLTSLLGNPMVPTQSGEIAQYGWRSPDGMTAFVTEFGEGSQRIIWLTISVAGYGAAKDRCWAEPAANNRSRGP